MNFVRVHTTSSYQMDLKISDRLAKKGRSLEGRKETRAKWSREKTPQKDEKELGKIEGGVKHSHEKGNGLGTGPKWADMEDDEE